MISNEKILSIFKLAKLYADEENIDEITKDINKILDFADTIDNADNITAEFDNINNLKNVFREDNIDKSFDKDEILSGVPENDDDFFILKNTL